MDADFIDLDEVVALTRISVQGLATLRYSGKGPRFYKPTPKTVLYKRSEVLAWIEESAQTKTGERVSA